MTSARQPVHASVVAARTSQGWRGLLIEGPSGAGKSDLTLRLMQDGWRLVGDDWVEVFACRGALYASVPDTIAGRMEVRGVGIVTRPFRPWTRLALALRLTREPVERLPQPTWRVMEGVPLPQLDLDPRPASAAAVATAALHAVSAMAPPAL